MVGGGITGEFKITDDLDNSQLIIEGGPPNGSDIDLGALIKNLAGSDILGSSFTLGDVKVRALVNMVEGGPITVVISGSFKQSTLYGIFQKTRDNSTSPYSAAFAAVIDGPEFSELIKSVTGVDISGVPVLGSLSIPEIGITISTDDICSSILSEIFSSEPLLRISGEYIRSGLVAYYNLSTDQGNMPVYITYSKRTSTLSFLADLHLVFDRF